jgi:hypothetical protein
VKEEAVEKLKLAAILLVAALFLRHTIIGVLLALAAAGPAAYATWLGSQEEGQKTYAYGLLLFLGSLGLAVVLFVLWLF